MAGFLECPICKRKIVEAIGLYFLQNGHVLLQGQQHLVLAGYFTTEYTAPPVHGHYVQELCQK